MECNGIKYEGRCLGLDLALALDITILVPLMLISN